MVYDIERWNDNRAKTILCTESRTVSALEAWCAMNKGGRIEIRAQPMEIQRSLYKIAIRKLTDYVSGIPIELEQEISWEESIIAFALTMGAVVTSYDIEKGTVDRMVKTSNGLFKMTMFEAQKQISDGEYWYDKKDNFLNKPSQ